MIMRQLNRTNWLKGLFIGVICISVLAACGGRRAPTESIPANPPQATTAPQATAAPQKTQPTVTPAQPTSAPTVIPPKATSTATATPAGPAKSSQSGAALDQLLEQLFSANSSADQLNDVPQLK
jgi:hypothetical protein